MKRKLEDSPTSTIPSTSPPPPVRIKGSPELFMESLVSNICDRINDPEIKRLKSTIGLLRSSGGLGSSKCSTCGFIGLYKHFVFCRCRPTLCTSRMFCIWCAKDHLKQEVSANLFLSLHCDTCETNVHEHGGTLIPLTPRSFSTVLNPFTISKEDCLDSYLDNYDSN